MDEQTRDYIDTRIKDIENQISALSKYQEQHFKLNELAIVKAEEAMLTRLENMNQFREQLNKERGEYVTKESYALAVDTLDSRLKKLEMAAAFSSGKMWVVMACFAAIPTIVAVVSLVRT